MIEQMDDKKHLGIIEQLMQLLQDKMEYGKDDLSERLGRNKKPDLEVTKIGIDADPMAEEAMEGEEKSPLMASGDDEQEEEEMASPEDKLKQRLMKLRA